MLVPDHDTAAETETMGEWLGGAHDRVFAAVFPGLSPGDEINEVDAISRLLVTMLGMCVNGDEGVCGLLRSWQWKAAQDVLEEFAEERDTTVWAGGLDQQRLWGEYVSGGPVIMPDAVSDAEGRS
jgi:hypothetical protein